MVERVGHLAGRARGPGADARAEVTRGDMGGGVAHALQRPQQISGRQEYSHGSAGEGADEEVDAASGQRDGNHANDGNDDQAPQLVSGQLALEAVTHAPDGENTYRLAGLFLDLLTQPADVDVHGA